MDFNEYQTPLENLALGTYPDEIQEQFYDFINNVPFIRNLISTNRKRAKDLEKDKSGRIIIDITQPHILEDMDYFRQAAIKFQRDGRYTDLRPNPNPNSEYGKWIREEVRRCYEGLVRPSDGEWITGDYYFFLNYSPMSLVETDEDGLDQRVIGFPRIWEGHYYLFHYLYQARQNKKHAFQLASRAKGKAHPYDTKVYTPGGIKLWKDIKIGDYLYGDDGQLTKVIGMPFDDIAPIYKFTLADGRTIESSEGHLWKVISHTKKKEVTLTTSEIYNTYKLKRKVNKKTPNGIEYNYSIPANAGIETEYKETKVDPYTFGLLLGDGCFRDPEYINTVKLTLSKEDFNCIKQYIPYTYNSSLKEIEHYLRIPNIQSILKEYNLYMKKSEDKFIPDEYKFNSKQVRKLLLKGLIDSDGTVSTTGKIQIDLSSRKLIDDIIFICTSLGYNYRLSSRIPNYFNKKLGKKVEGKRSYRLSIYTNDIISNLPRKVVRMSIKYNNSYSQSKIKGTKIINVEYIGEKKAKCVTVDNNSHCYLIGEFITTHNSFVGASMLSKRFILGESAKVTKKVICYITASDKKYLDGGDQTLNKFVFDIDHCAINTQFPSRKLVNSLNDMQWVSGYKDLDTGTNRGTLNSVVGVSSSKDESKLRGTRGVLYILEEAGTFSKLLNTYGNLRHSVEQGKKVYGTIFAYGTAGDNDSDFSSMQEIMYNPNGYNVQAINNVYDKEGQSRKEFVYFFPGYLNYEGYYNENGVSDVTGALLEILKDRYEVKYNSTDLNAITKRIAESPIVPQEAILRTRGNIFPVTQLNERINQLDINSTEYDDVYTGELVLGESGSVRFVPTNARPLREFPLKQDTPARGAIEIFQMPEEDKTGKVPSGRYIAGFDPYDNDQAESSSLGSVFVLDLFTDKIVAEYTGRTSYAEECYEIVRLFCLFYNAKCLYESNKKGTFAYFSKMNSTHLLADTPEYLRDKQLVKYSSFGSGSKGVNASQAINNYANQLIKDWLLKPVTIVQEEDGEQKEVTISNLYFIRNRALLKELVLYNPQINVDRIRALGMLMLYREEKMVLYGGDITQEKVSPSNANYLGNDEFFMRNYNWRFNKP